MKFEAMKKITIYILATLLIANYSYAVEFPVWDVPADAASVENPVESNNKSIGEGETIFQTQCIACHGPKADGNGAVPAASLISEAFQKQSDGAVFYKLENGRGTMPSFKALGEENLWKVINYLRSLTADVDAVAKLKGGVNLEVKEENGERKVYASFYKLAEDGSQIPAADVKASVYVKRYFGNLPIPQDANYTNAEGMIVATIPSTIRGDKEGNFEVVGILEDRAFEQAEKTLALSGGVIPENTFGDSWETEKALWRTNPYLPWWIKFMYVGITGGVLLAIGYVLLLIRKIKLEGK